MNGGDVETFHQGDKWWNRIGGCPSVQGPYRTLLRAAEDGRNFARDIKTAHVIRGLDDEVVESHNYSDN